MPKFFGFGLALLSLYQVPQGGQRSTHSARLGDMQITLVAARIASDQESQDYWRIPPAGRKVVLVFLRMKNVARYPSCSFPDEWLRVRQGYEYHRFISSKLQAPQTSSVLPTEESSGAFVFEIKEGTEPVALKLVRNVFGDDFCATSQHRDTHIVGPESVSLSLLGLPANTEQPSARQGQPPAPTKQPSAEAQPKIESEEQQSNVIPMNDGFEYKVIDYGVGRIQVRNQGARNAPVPETKSRFGLMLPKPKELGDFTEQVFWVKFQITNKAEHLIGNRRYFPSVGALRTTDNWGNVYSLRYPNSTDVGGNWLGAELPIPSGGETREQYKPNESSWAVRLIAADQFVAQVKELRIYLANQFEYPKFYFKIEEPLSRHRDLLRSQVEPEPTELGIKVVPERQVPSTR